MPTVVPAPSPCNLRASLRPERMSRATRSVAGRLVFGRVALRSIALTLAASTLLAFGSRAAAQSAQPATTPIPGSVQATPAATPAAPRKLLESVVFVGASATAGFGVIVTDPEKAKRSLPLPLSASFIGAVTSLGDEATLRNVGSSLFFLSPGVTGKAQIDRAIEARPTLVVGIDFLFWYGYGSDDGAGGVLQSETGRLEKLKLGFAELERIDASVPIVVGDFPDMSAAVGKMISQDQMPAPSTLASLNEALRTWAKGRPNVLLFPLSELAGKLKGGEPISIAGVTFRNDDGRLLQSDQLHPTARGSIAMSLRLAELLREKFGDGAGIVTASDEPTAQRRSLAAAERLIAQRSGGSKPLGGGTTPGSEDSRGTKSAPPAAPAAGH